MVTYWELFDEVNKDNVGWVSERNQLRKIHNMISTSEDYNPYEYENILNVRKIFDEYFKEHDTQISVQYNYLRVLRKYLKLTGKISEEHYLYYDTWTRELLAIRNANSKLKKKGDIIVPNNFISIFKTCVETCKDYSLRIIGYYLISAYELNDIMMFKVTLSDFIETTICGSGSSSGSRSLDLKTGIWSIYKHGALIKYKIQLQPDLISIILTDRLDTNYFIYNKNMIYSTTNTKYVCNKIISNSLTQKFKRMYGYSWTDAVSYFTSLILDKLDKLDKLDTSSELSENLYNDVNSDVSPDVNPDVNSKSCKDKDVIPVIKKIKLKLIM